MDQLNVAANERIDLSDFQFSSNSVPTGLVNEVTSSFFVANGQNWVVSGFAPSIITTPLAVQVGDNANPNVGLLGQRSGATILSDVLCTAGTASQTVALTGFAAGTYGLFIRFARNPGAAAQRVYWDGTNTREYTQLTNTRNVAQFEVRVESVAPSAEWLQIGTITVTSSTAATVTDTRPFYFEGSASNGYAPTWGTAADRNATRIVRPIADLRTMIDALKQAIIDIKGQGLAGWYTSNVQGLNVGSGFSGSNPLSNRLAVGDANLYLARTPLGSNFQYNLYLGNSAITGDNKAGATTNLYVSTVGTLNVYAVNYQFTDNQASQPLYPAGLIWSAGLVSNDLTSRIGGNILQRPPQLSAGTYTLTFANPIPTGAFILTQAVSAPNPDATGYSVWGVATGSVLTVRMSRGSATQTTTPTAFYYCIIAGP